MGNEGLIVIDRSGRVSASSSSVQKTLSGRAGRWRLVAAPASLLVLQRAPDEGIGVERVVRLAGTIMARGELTDVVTMIHAARWEGSLHVLTGEDRKTLLVREGDVVGAASTAEVDRLGELLCARGVLTREQLDGALAEAGGPQGLGAVLIARELLTPKILHGFLRKQVEQIFYSLLFLAEGSYYFLRRGLSDPAFQQLRLPLSGLVLEGARRVDELRHARERIPSAKVVLEATGPVDESSLEAAERVVYRLVDGSRRLSEITLEGHLSEYDAIKAAAQLVEAGILRLHCEDLLRRRGRAPRVTTPESLLARVNGLMVRLHEESLRLGREGELRSAPGLFKTSPSQGVLFLGVTLRDDGTLPSGVVLENLARSGDSAPAELLYRGLNEFLTFTLALVAEELDPDDERKLREKLLR